MEKYYERIERGGNRTALIFVHGILGHYRETWADFPNLVLQDSSLNHCDIICWGYPSRLITAKFGWLPKIPYIGNRMPDLVSVADALGTDLLNQEIGGSYPNLVLVGHSMGGLVVKQLIISALQKLPEDTALVDRIKGVLLYATPSDGVHLPAIFKIHPQAKTIACDQLFVNELRNQWINRVHLVRPDDPRQPGKRYIPVTAVIGLEDDAVSKDSAASHYSSVKTAAGNHSEVCKPTSKDNTSFQILKIVASESSTALVVLQTGKDVSDVSTVDTLDVPASTSTETKLSEQAVEGDQSGWVEAFDAMEKSNFDEAYRLFKHSCEGQGGLGLESLAFACFELYTRGWAPGFTHLKQLSLENPSVSDIFYWLGQAYKRAAQWDKTVECFRKCLNNQPAGPERLRITKLLATCLISDGKSQEALSELRNELREAQDPPDKSNLYKTLGEILLEVRKSDPLLGIACYEKALALHPGSSELRFHLAYEHRDTISPEVSFYHYRIILRQGPPHQYAANNAGARASELHLPLTSIDYYSTAAEKDLTLSMANMAGNLIDAGFEKLAKELLEKARQLPDVHENVDIHLGRIPKKRQEEEKKLKELDRKASVIVQWRQREAEAIAEDQVDIQSLVGLYSQNDGPVANLSIKEDGTIYGESKSPRELITFKGRIEGSLLRFTWDSTPTEKPSSLLAGAGLLAFGTPQANSGTGVLIIKPGGEVLTGYRLKKDAPLDPRDWSLTRIRETAEA